MKVSLLSAAVVMAAAASAPARAQLVAGGSDPLTELSRMSLEQLSNVEVIALPPACCVTITPVREAELKNAARFSVGIVMLYAS